jgi:hypothetical protein
MPRKTPLLDARSVKTLMEQFALNAGMMLPPASWPSAWIEMAARRAASASPAAIAFTLNWRRARVESALATLVALGTARQLDLGSDDETMLFELATRFNYDRPCREYRLAGPDEQLYVMAPSAREAKNVAATVFQTPMEKWRVVSAG